MEVHILLAMIKRAIEEVINGRIQVVNFKFSSKWDLDMEKTWSFKQSSDHKLKDRKVLKQNTTWQKLNFGGASRGNPGQSGLGAIIRDEVDEVVHVVSGPIGIENNNMVEIAALEAGLQWSVKNKIDKLIIEGDSQIILNSVSKSTFQGWRLAAWISRIKSLLNLLGEYQIQHKFQEGNKATDQLANMGIEEGSVREFSRTEIDPIVHQETMSLAFQEVIARDRESITRIGVG
ncbi:hypothetical protein SUGI_0738740 [Cryptomeria japonica]|nr:hypothetical protein SUGI_0738740 [Cryptomeria japonica]